MVGPQLGPWTRDDRRRRAQGLRDQVQLHQRPTGAWRVSRQASVQTVRGAVEAGASDEEASGEKIPIEGLVTGTVAAPRRVVGNPRATPLLSALREEAEGRVGLMPGEGLMSKTGGTAVERKGREPRGRSVPVAPGEKRLVGWLVVFNARQGRVAVRCEPPEGHEGVLRRGCLEAKLFTQWFSGSAPTTQSSV